MTWLKDYGPVIGAMAGVLVAFAAVLQLVVVGPINNRFDAVDQRFNDLRSEMNQRLNDLRAEMNQRFDQQDKYINARFDAVDQRFEAVDQRFNDLRAEMHQRFDVVDQRLGRLESDVSELRTLSDRVSRNEGRIDLLTEQLQVVPAPTR